MHKNVAQNMSSSQEGRTIQFVTIGIGRHTTEGACAWLEGPTKSAKFTSYIGPESVPEE